MTHSDDNGLVLPPKLAPYQVVLIPIYHNDEEYKKLKVVMQGVSETLRSKNIRVKEDFRDTHKPGWKFAQYELKGVPIRLVMGPRDLEKNTIELFRRDTLVKKVLKLEDVGEEVVVLLDEIQDNLFKRAKLFNEKNTFLVDDFSIFQEKINQGGFVLAHWDGTSDTENEIKKLTKATIRCIPIDVEKESGKCILTGKPSLQRVVFAKSY